MSISLLKFIRENWILFLVKKNKIRFKVLLLQRNYSKLKRTNFTNSRNRWRSFLIKINQWNINYLSLVEKTGLKVSISKLYSWKSWLIRTKIWRLSSRILNICKKNDKFGSRITFKASKVLKLRYFLFDLDSCSRIETSQDLE